MALNDFKLTILAQALAALRKRATFARAAYRDLSARLNAAAQGETLQFNYITKPTVGDVPTLATSLGGAVAEPQTTTRTLTLDHWKRVYWDVNDRDSYSVGGEGFTAIGATYGAALADQIEADMFQHVAENVAEGAINHGTTAQGTAFNNTNATRTALRLLASRDADMGQFFMFVSPTDQEDFLGASDFTRADFRGQVPATEIQTTGDLGTSFGFRFIVSNNIPSVTRGANSGAVNRAGGVTAGATVIPVDAAGASGINPGEVVLFGGQLYAVKAGISGVAGNITIDRPLAANVADNTALGRRFTHRPAWAMNPNAFALAMRPTVAPRQQGNGSIRSLVDPGTGFSLTLEETRIQSGTRYTLSALYGFTVVRPEMIVRIATPVV